MYLPVEIMDIIFKYVDSPDMILPFGRFMLPSTIKYISRIKTGGIFQLIGRDYRRRLYEAYYDHNREPLRATESLRECLDKISLSRMV